MNIFKQNTIILHCLHYLSTSNKFQVPGSIIYVVLQNTQKILIIKLVAKIEIEHAVIFILRFNLTYQVSDVFTFSPLLAKMFNVFILSMIETNS